MQVYFGNLDAETVTRFGLQQALHGQAGNKIFSASLLFRQVCVLPSQSTFLVRSQNDIATQHGQAAWAAEGLRFHLIAWHQNKGVRCTLPLHADPWAP